MKHEATPQEIQCVREGIEAVRQALAALKEQEQQNLKDLADYGLWQQGAMIRAVDNDPRDAASVETYMRDKATAELWANHFAGGPRRKQALEYQRDWAVLDLIERRIWAVTDWFEEKWNPLEALKAGGLENAIAVAEKILSRRLPEHPEIIEVAGGVDKTWLERTYHALLEGSTPEPAT
jgi:hypothetical protein